jgi:hypothetical protein
MLKLYTVLYSIFLILVLLLQLIAKIIVGAAGHVSAYNTSEYFITGVIIITFLSLLLYSRNIISSIIIKYTNIVLVSALTLAVVYMLIVTIRDGDIDFITLMILILQILFIILSIALIRTLITHKHS